jgi:succinyl-diaminopimelate desuccinylase
MEEPIEEVRQEVIDLLDDLKARRDNFDYEIREINRVIPSMTDKSAPVVTTIHDAICDVLGHDPTYVASPGSYDQKHIDRIGKLKNCIAYGPGVLELAHKPDEWIGITDMLDSAKVMSRALETLLLP